MSHDVASHVLVPPPNRLYDGLLRSPDLRGVPELIALMVNLLSSKHVAEVRCHLRIT